MSFSNSKACQVTNLCQEDFWVLPILLNNIKILSSTTTFFLRQTIRSTIIDEYLIHVIKRNAIQQRARTSNKDEEEDNKKKKTEGNLIQRTGERKREREGYRYRHKRKTREFNRKQEKEQDIDTMKDKAKETDNSTEFWRKIISHTFNFSWSASQLANVTDARPHTCPSGRSAFFAPT